MTFADAMECVVDGTRLTRTAWADEMVCIFLMDDRLRIKLADRTIHDLIVSRGDLEAADWAIVTDAHA